MEKVQVSIIIINYNTLEMTQECIDSVIKQTKDISYEIILVDNKSIDDSKQHFEKDNRIRYFYSFENLGFGRANNLGMILSRGEYVFLLNSDTLLVNNAVKLFYDNAEAQKQHKAFWGGWLLDNENNYIHSFAEIKTMRSLLSDAVATYVHIFNKSKVLDLQTQYVDSSDIKEVGYVTGADLFFHRSIFENYGAFDHNFFMYYEECDWQLRMKEHGINSYVIKGPSIIHLCGQQRGKPQKQRSIVVKMMNLKSMKYYLKKHYGPLRYFMFRIVYFSLKLIPVLFDGRYYTFKDRVKYLRYLAS